MYPREYNTYRQQQPMPQSYSGQSAYDQKVQARIERLETVRALVNCKMEEGGDVSSHVLKMMNHLVHLKRFGDTFPREIAVDMILLSLPESFDTFIMIYNMNGWEKTLPELFNMLTTFEKSIPKKTSPVLVIREGGIKKPKPYKKKVAKTPQPKKKVAEEDACFECGVIGHWKRNCPTYLAELKKKKAEEGSAGV